MEVVEMPKGVTAWNANLGMATQKTSLYSKHGHLFVEQSIEGTFSDPVSGL